MPEYGFGVRSACEGDAALAELLAKIIKAYSSFTLMQAPQWRDQRGLNLRLDVL